MDDWEKFGGTNENESQNQYQYQYTDYGQEPYRVPKKEPKYVTRKFMVVTLIFAMILSAAVGAGAYALAMSTFGGTTINKSVTTTNYNLSKATGSELSIQEIVALNENSVVAITTEAIDYDFWMRQYVTEGAGSGVIISADGYIVTNNHVISGASNITVRLYNGDEFKAELIGKDAQTDIAVIKINAENLTPVIMGESTNLVIGELTVAIGNPLGELGGTVTDGIISALDREITVEGENMILLQTNAAVSPGNSGGGLFNAKGELIGIVNAKSSGSSVEGLGFAIPITTAKPVIKDLIEKGHVTGRPSIGITIIEITSDYQKYMYGVSDYGVYIQQALNEEFQAGDRIIAIDGNSISTSSDIKAILHEHTVGDKITVTVSRKNKIVDVEVTLIDSADNTLSTQ